MFCKECGSRIDAGAKFCSECGASAAPEDSKKKQPLDCKTPILSARPVFIPWVTIVSVVPLQLFVTLWSGMFFGIFSIFAAGILRLQIPYWLPPVLFGGLPFIGIPLVTYFTKRKTYNKTEYLFYADRIEYAEGFWTVEHKTIKYKDIIEVDMREGVIQRRYGLGTIILSTPGIIGGIRLRDVKDTRVVHSKVRELIGRVEAGD